MIISELNKIKAVKFGDADISKVYSGEDKVFPEEGGYFYVCHSSTGLIEKLPVSSSIDWPALVTKNHIYGGLFSNWAGKGDYAKAIEAGTLDDSLFVDNKLQDVNYVSYDGSVANTKNKFVRANAYNSVQVPIKNKIYYICEPVKEYLDNTICEVKADAEKNIISVVFVSAIDNVYYKDFAYFINDEFVSNCGVYSSYSIRNASTGETTTIKAKDVNSSLVRGYVAIASINLDTPNVWFKVNMRYVTCDNYIINYAKTSYIYTGDLTTDTFISQDYPPTT